MQILTSTDSAQKFIYLIELYRELGVKEPYTSWINKVIDKEMENVDYWREYVDNKPVPRTEYIPLEAAREIALAGNTDQAFTVYRQIRQNAPDGKMDFIIGGLPIK